MLEDVVEACGGQGLGGNGVVASNDYNCIRPLREGLRLGSGELWIMNNSGMLLVIACSTAHETPSSQPTTSAGPPSAATTFRPDSVSASPHSCPAISQSQPPTPPQAHPARPPLRP